MRTVSVVVALLAAVSCQSTPCNQLPPSLTDPTDLDTSCSPYVAGYLEIDAPVILEAGVTIQFGNSGEMLVTAAGSLTVNGTSAQPVILEALDGGRWDGLVFDGETSAGDVNGLEIRGGGEDDLCLPGCGWLASLVIADDAAVRLRDVSVIGSENTAMVLHSALVEGSQNVSLDGQADVIVGTFEPFVASLPPLSLGTTNPAAQIWVSLDAGTVVESGEWASQSAPFVLEDLTVGPGSVPQDVTLTLDAPNTLLFVPGAGVNVTADAAYTGTAGIVARGAVAFDEQFSGSGWNGISFAGRVGPSSELTGGTIAHGAGGAYAASGLSGSPTVAASVQIDLSEGVGDFPNLHDESISNPVSLGDTVCVVLVSNADQPPDAGYPLGVSYQNCGDANVYWAEQP